METPFDLQRAILLKDPFTPPLHNPVLLSAIAAQQDASFQYSDRVLLTKIDAYTLVFPLLPLGYYHTIQGSVEGHPWMVSFCVICNAGTCFSPVLDGREYHFTANGIYNGMTLLVDQETESVWNHLTGACLHGALVGQQLTLIDTMQHFTFQQAVEAAPNALFVPAPLSREALQVAEEGEAVRLDPALEFAYPDSEASLGQEDTRLPRLEAGLGIWEGRSARFYSLRTLNAANNLIVDHFAGKTLLVYVDPATDDPHACYVDAESAAWRGEVLHLANGQTIRNAVLYDASKTRAVLQQPLQHFQRWYSFAFTFPNAEIYALPRD